MDKSKLKSYAPQARKDFIAMVQSRAAQLGIAEVKGQLHAEPAEVQGDVAVIAGQAFPAKVARQRDMLLARMQKDGFAATVEAIAYTWFNRLAALRYMELHNFLGHGQRVLSSVTEGGLPDLLTHALEIVESGDLPGISVAEVSELKLASKDGELYKRLLVAQCNQLAGHMGFLFERIDDDSELMLPDNLLRSDSVVRKLIDSIDEDDWQQVEIIGWLYQFYISEKKDQVIGKVVKSADIPAATQLFTPNWIVKYLVQNSVGRLWLQANPASTLAGEMAYYIQPAEQTPEVNAQLDELIRARIAEDSDTLNPESITVLDPACGSGHILVEAYDLLKAIYRERGYRERDIPRLILEKNLFGLDIDDRAAQLAAFALLMKARADDRRLFTEPVQLNVFSLQESAGLDAAQLAQELAITDVAERQALVSLVTTFAQAKTFGSLLQISAPLAKALPALAARIAAAQTSGGLYAQSAATTLQPLLQQAQLLARQFDAVVANPPYLTSDYFPKNLKDFVESRMKIKRTDFYSLLLDRGLLQIKPIGFLSFVTRDSWMFLPTFENQRLRLLNDNTILNLSHLGSGAFDTISGQVVQTAMFTICSSLSGNYIGTYLDVRDGSSEQKNINLKEGRAKSCHIAQGKFCSLPASPIAYDVSKDVWQCFENNKPIGDFAELREGIHTGKNELFMRYWWEVDFSLFSSSENSVFSIEANKKRWIPYNKGGEFRKWYGNNHFVLGYDSEYRNRMSELKGHVRPSQSLYFKEGGTWTDVGSGSFGVRYYPSGFLFDGKGMAVNAEKIKYTIAMMNSKPFQMMANILMPTLNYKCGTTRKVPYATAYNLDEIEENADKAINLARDDWSTFETSWEFGLIGSLRFSRESDTLCDAWEMFDSDSIRRINEMHTLEEENNQYFIDAYKLGNCLDSNVTSDQICLARADREKDMQRLVSYAIGCMMGRYSLDEPGLIYAHAGNVSFDPARYSRFPADADGIVPVGDMAWFPDDATNRVKEFLLAVWGPDTLAENLAWLADSLGRKADETAEDALRRYISGSFFKDHCQTYKKRPIYWLFSSGKHKAFEALVYLHRYNEATLARMRAEYVVPLTGRMAERIQLLEDDARKASTGAARKALDKQVDKLKKKLEELRLFDEKLRHYADQRIELDLDDGVKVNYGKFGDLLDNVKAISGGSGDD
ncbi:BREX-1 system adenine-specific DNA-methyltransferase PglX [Laribacter hongkongensis]|uniref:BREX-1 system adenine-specific DNA-methyltransferase PglX n=1 Tax=Laribacter hongkongensis TaxID=168471 RepID=UPI001EFEEC5F|nr:BREX-1 system adenine-specific DNA-methyltransferase PglX [Laribacter hongkongensis]MCG9084050.1 BREX-1 system adenine-specific DNA-methyltransferase PglX [Laribacter hongkongensis]